MYGEQVDDDEVIRVMLSRTLRKAGVQRVDEASSGEACLAILDAGNEAYDFVTVDHVRGGRAPVSINRF